jgi:predicted anti-sigma-YlaC factor YlaD
MTMDCAEVRTLMSAAMDGDLQASTELEAHVAGCDGCTEWREEAHRLTRLGMESAPAGLTNKVASLLPKGFARYRWIRLALAWGGVLLVVWHAPGMIDSGSDLLIRHLSRHQHTFGVALGVVFLFVAWRPDRAYGTVPMAATFTVALAGAAIVDLVMGASTLSREASHLVEIIGLGLVWALGLSAGPGRRRHPGG